MPDLTRRNEEAPIAAPANTPGNAQATGPGVSNQAVQEAIASGAKDPEEVVLYLTLNNTTHRKDEIPETLSALEAAEAEGLGHRELMPISDPYAVRDAKGDLAFEDDTYSRVFGKEAAERVEWWHGDPELKEGQVRVDGEILTLGTSELGSDAQLQAEARNNWQTALMTLGMSQAYADAVVASLMKNDDGSFRELDSGDGATNELVQFAMAMYRAEIGEIEVKNIVFSGHHWREENYEGHGQGIWGEVAGGDHEYDDTSDYFSLEDVAALKDAFPIAYAGVKSVQLAACNTDNLGMEDENSEALSTNEFLQDTFENIEMSSYWKKVLAPLAASGAETNGEFILDSMRMESGDEEAAEDSRHNERGLKRILLDEDGALQEIKMSTKKGSYDGAKRKGLRGKNTDFDEREDLEDHLLQPESLPVQKKKPEASSS